MPDKGLNIPDPPKPGQPDRKNWLLIIGVDNYVHCAKLNNAVRDAKALRDLLLDAYSFDENRVITLFNEEATRAGIWEAFTGLKGKIKEGDNLLIYFSGHGHFEKDSKLSYWVPIEGQAGQEWSFVNFDTIKSILKPLKVHHLLLLVDSCYSGAHFVTRDLGSAAPRLERDPSRFMIASGRNEVVRDGEAGKNSPFAESLLRLLEEYRHTGVNTAELSDKLTKNVAWNAAQTPIAEALDQLGHLGGQFIFHPRRNEARDWKLACDHNTAAAYSSFMSAWPQSTRLEEAHWKRASLLNTLEAYRQYLDKFLHGPHADEAIDCIEEMEDSQRFEKARRRGQAGLLRFIKDYPDSRHAGAAREELRQLREQVAEPQAWRIAANENSLAAYERYLSEYPDGSNAAEARSSIANIREEAEAEKSRAEAARARQEAEAKQLAEAKARREAEDKRRAEEAAKEKALREERRKKRLAAPWWKRPPAIAGGVVLLALLVWGISSLGGPKEETTSPGPVSTIDTLDTENGLSQQQTDAPATKKAAVPVEPPATSSLSPLEQLKEDGYTIGDFVDGVAIYSKGTGNSKVMGLVNNAGTLLGDEYDLVEALQNGYAVCHKNNKRGYLNLKGEEIIQPQYNVAWGFGSNGLAKVRLGSHTFYINNKNECKRDCEKPDSAPVASNTGTSTTSSGSPIEPQMVYVQGGSFMMGSPKSEAGRDDDEDQHRVDS